MASLKKIPGIGLARHAVAALTAAGLLGLIGMAGGPATARAFSALVLAIYHPQQFVYAGSMSGFLNLSNGQWPGLVNVAMRWDGGFDSNAMWDPPSNPAWAHNDPTVNVSKLVANNTRIWIYCGNHTSTPLDVSNPNTAGLGSLEGLAINSKAAFKNACLGAGGSNGVFNFPNGTHTWGYWGQQLQEMKADLQRVLGATTTAT
jgi:diacylglycerol O-acyltransferase / trehalose O-mycolyltransferase